MMIHTRRRLCCFPAILAALCLLAWTTSGHAMEATEHGRYRKVYLTPAPATLVIDGDLKDWDRSGQLELFADPATRDRRFARLVFMHDSDALYIGGEVGNLVPLTNPNDPAVNPEFGWNGDALQVRLAIDRSLPFPLPQSLNRTDAPGIMHLALWCFADKMQPVLHLARGMKLDSNFNPAYPKGVVPADKFTAKYVKHEGNRYTFEYRIPWATLGATNPPRAGDVASLTMQLHWADGNPGSVYQLVVVRDVMMGSGFGFQAVDSWGKAIYSPTGNLPAEVTQPATALPPPLPLAFTYDLPRDAEVTIALQDAQGRYVRSLESQVQHKQGKVAVAWDGLDEYGKPLPAGKYTWKGIHHEPITTKHVMSVHNSGQPGYFSADGTGSWGGDHGEPMAVCVGPDFLLLGWDGCEVGKGVIRTDLTGRKQAGFTFAVDWLATDGERFFAFNAYHKTGVRVHRVADGRPLAYGNGATALQGPTEASDSKTPLPLTGLAWAGGELFAAYEAADVIVVFDAASGAEKRRLNLPAPRGVAALPGGGLAAISAGKLVRIDAATASVTPLADTHLDEPFAVAAAADGRTFVSNRGTLQNVSVFAPDGKYLRSIGKPGGRPGLGGFEKDGMFNPAGIAVAPGDRLWVMEHDASPKRISVWDAAGGGLVNEFFGPGAYATHVAVDPARPDEAFCHNTLWKIDLEKGTWYPKSTLIRRVDPNNPPDPGSQGLTATMPLTADNGRQYFFMHTTYGRPFTVWRREGDVGRPFLMIFGRRKYMDANWQKIAPAPVFQDNERFPADDTQPFFAWQDGNDDAVIQPDEVQRIAANLWFTTSAGGWQMDRGLKLYNLSKGVAFTPVRITDKGQPLYDFRKPEQLSAEPWDKSLQDYNAGFFLAEDGKSFFAYNQDSPEGRGVARWSLDGKLLWRTGGSTTLHWQKSLTQPVARPGELYGLVSPMRTAGGIVGWASYFGVFHLFTEDGLYLAKCFRDMREGQVGPDVLFTEHFCGILARIPETGRTYILGGDTDGRITEVLGLDSIKKFGGSYEITPAEFAKAEQARAEHATRQVAARSLKIARGKAALPTAAEVVVTVDDKRGFDARLAVDEKNLYLDYEVRTPAQLVNNTDNPQILFRGGNAIDLQLATDPGADPARAKAVPGDLRLLVTQDKAKKPVAVLYRTKVKGFTGQPIALTSVVQAGSLATENFDAIEVVSDKITLEYTPRSVGFGATVTIPLELLGWKPEPGKPVRLDLGYLFGDSQGNKCMLRSYWTNKSQLSGIINDVPSESRLEPKEWGAAVVEAAAAADEQQVGNVWQGKRDPAAHTVGWSARKPVVKDGKIPAWEVAPEFLKWRDADPAADGFAGQVLTVTLTGPFADGAWSQHAGALLRLDQAIPAQQPFTVRFKARSLSGSKNLSVLRSWGGATPWESIAISPEWQEYAVTLTPEFPTDTLSFSLVPKAGRLQSYCAGSFELSGGSLVAGCPVDAGLDLDAYFAEPKDLPYDEEILAEKQEDGWHWKQFRYTSLVYGGEPIRIHAVYAAPDHADAAHPVPAILMTHGIFGAVRGRETRYWSAVTSFVKAGYAVLFFDWYPNFAHDFNPKSPDEPKPFSTFGKLDYFTPSYRYTLPGNDWKDSLHYQVVMAAKRGVSWLQARPEVDGKAIGATGWSYGGIFSSMIAGIDKRIAAVNPCVYTARFGPGEESYTNLGDKEFKDEEVLRLWQSRFDSYTLLAKRPVPVLYTIGANDNVFSVTKAMACFAAMAGPKHLLIGPNEGHGYWAEPQGIQFFDSVLKKSGPRPTVSNLAVRLEGAEVVAAVQATGEIKEVEYFVATVFEKDPIRGWTGIPAFTWKWTGMKAVKTADGRYEARWPLPAMRPMPPREALYRWGEGDRFDPAAPPPPAVDADKLQGAIHVFARVTDSRGVQECSPLTQPLLFADAATTVTPIAHALPKLEAAVRVATKTVVELTPANAGNPVATLDLPLPVKAVGKAGYVLWNWRKEKPSATLTTDGAATPTKSIAVPFVDTIKADSFNGFNPLPGPPFSTAGKLAFRINGKDGLADKVDGWHGSVAQGHGGAEEIQLQPQDDAEHRVTLVMVGGIGEANVRVSVRAADGATETVQYVQTMAADNVFQFRFAGPVVLRVETTSAPFRRQDGVAMQHLTPIGPSALFLD